MRSVRAALPLLPRGYEAWPALPEAANRAGVKLAVPPASANRGAS